MGGSDTPMKIIVINEQPRMEFILRILSVSKENPFNIKVEGTNLYCENALLIEMIRRCVNHQTFLLPMLRPKEVLWFLLSENNENLNKHANEIRHFIVPVLAESFPQGCNKFDRSKGLGDIAVDIFPNGYYCFRSPKGQMKEVMSMLDLWTQLDNKRPTDGVEEDVVNAFTLRSRFQQALALQQWDDAEIILNLIKQGHYVTDENIKFSEIQLLSSQSRWVDI